MKINQFWNIALYAFIFWAGICMGQWYTIPDPPKVNYVLQQPKIVINRTVVDFGCAIPPMEEN
jgi:hypothetical protein